MGKIIKVGVSGEGSRSGMMKGAGVIRESVFQVYIDL